MKKLTIRQKNDGSWVEVLADLGNPEIFVTAARGDDREDDERVVILSPKQALRLGEALVRAGRRALT